MCFIRLTRLEIACVKHVCDVGCQLSLWLIRHALREFLDKKSYLNNCDFMGLNENKSKSRAKLFATSMDILASVNWVKQGDDVIDETSKEAPFML